MPVSETYGVMGFVDENGEQKIHYPITQAELALYDNGNSGLSADNAQAALDELSARMPQGIFNVFLKDATTNTMYALVMDNGHLGFVPTEAVASPVKPTFIDASTGARYTMGINNGQFYIEEVTSNA